MSNDVFSTDSLSFGNVFFLSNNNVQDDGVRDILEGLINQVNEDKTGRGLSILILWNNRLTKNSSPYFSRIIVCIITNILRLFISSLHNRNVDYHCHDNFCFL